MKKYRCLFRGVVLIVGSGCDILYIDRVKKLLSYKNFLNKYFTINEIEMFSSQKNINNYVKKVASNLCVKEAFFKSISHKIDKFSFKDIEVLRNDTGRPSINLVNEMEKFKDKINIHITISNESRCVISFVLLEQVS